MPNFQIGCKRMLISNNYFPTLAQDNVDLVTEGIEEVTANGIVSKTGTTREIDAIVVATGFHVTDSPTFAGIFGKDGRSLAEVFEETGMQGYKGAAVANFPNMFFLVGPNTGLGHSSMVFMIESQINYLVDAIATIDKYDIGTIEVRKDKQDKYNKDLQAAMSKSVWEQRRLAPAGTWTSTETTPPCGLASPSSSAMPPSISTSRHTAASPPRISAPSAPRPLHRSTSTTRRQ